MYPENAKSSLKMKIKPDFKKFNENGEHLSNSNFNKSVEIN